MPSPIFIPTTRTRGGLLGIEMIQSDSEREREMKSDEERKYTERKEIFLDFFCVPHGQDKERKGKKDGSCGQDKGELTEIKSNPCGPHGKDVR